MNLENRAQLAILQLTKRELNVSGLQDSMNTKCFQTPHIFDNFFEAITNDPLLYTTPVDVPFCWANS